MLAVVLEATLLAPRDRLGRRPNYHRTTTKTPRSSCFERWFNPRRTGIVTDQRATEPEEDTIEFEPLLMSLSAPGSIAISAIRGMRQAAIIDSVPTNPSGPTTLSAHVRDSASAMSR